MTTLQILRVSSTVLVFASLIGCASNGPSHRVVRDKTPSWMMYQVTGSRIARRADGRGKVTGADIVRSTSTPGGLALLPGATVNTSGI